MKNTPLSNHVDILDLSGIKNNSSPEESGLPPIYPIEKYNSPIVDTNNNLRTSVEIEDFLFDLFGILKRFENELYGNQGLKYYIKKIGVGSESVINSGNTTSLLESKIYQFYYLIQALINEFNNQMHECDSFYQENKKAINILEQTKNNIDNERYENDLESQILSIEKMCKAILDSKIIISYKNEAKIKELNELLTNFYILLPEIAIVNISSDIEKLSIEINNLIDILFGKRRDDVFLFNKHGGFIRLPIVGIQQAKEHINRADNYEHHISKYDFYGSTNGSLYSKNKIENTKNPLNYGVKSEIVKNKHYAWLFIDGNTYLKNILSYKDMINNILNKSSPIINNNTEILINSITDDINIILTIPYNIDQNDLDESFKIVEELKTIGASVVLQTFEEENIHIPPKSNFKKNDNKKEYHDFIYNNCLLEIMKLYEQLNHTRQIFNSARGLFNEKKIRKFSPRTGKKTYSGTFKINEYQESRI